MFNFLNSKLSPKVVCKSPSSDNYEIENLISENYADKIRGFIAYPAIKPPVEIDFEFICPVNIHFLIVNSTVGTQKCTGIELFVINQDGAVSIAKAVYDKEKIGVYFCNSRKFSVANPPDGFNADLFHIFFFKGTTFRSFLNAASIRLVIFRTEKSVPCLQSVEVWGTPSKYCSAMTVQTINRIMQKQDKDLLLQFEPQVNKNSENKEGSSNTKFLIPNDFKDDLTYEVMTIPMTLPSGKTVDRSTLDKHIESEIPFGRKPCDPFTGIKFSDNMKPVLNVALKSRIDMFLLQNSYRAETFELKRTLGGSNKRTDSQVTKKIRLQNSGDADELDKIILNAKATSNFNKLLDEEKSSCSECKKYFEFLYLLPCKHYFCRVCLLEICKHLKCSVCKKLFEKKNVQKCDM